jgi:hypothetical protein
MLPDKSGGGSGGRGSTGTGRRSYGANSLGNCLSNNHSACRASLCAASITTAINLALCCSRARVAVLSQQIESALVIGDDDWLDELAKAIREGKSLKEQRDRAQFIAKVLDLLQKMAGASAGDICLELHTEELQPDGTWKLWDKKKKLSGRLRVAGHIFETKASAMDAINDIATAVDHELKRINKPHRHE